MEVGTIVEWTKVERVRGNIRMSQCYGMVAEILGDIAVIKRRNGRLAKISIDRLHVTGSGPNQLMKFAEGLINACEKSH